MIGEKIINVNNDNINHHIVEICKIFNDYHNSISTAQEEKYYDGYIDAYFAFESKLTAFGIDFAPLELTDKLKPNILKVVSFFEAMNNKYTKRSISDYATDTIETTRIKYRKKLNIGFFYTFSDGDLERIKSLINELRDLITKSTLFSADHKERILKKLENLQKELHKNMSSLDNIWGFIGDAGIVLGKFGIDAKPFVDRISELMQITWRTQAIAEELPTGTPLPLLTDKIEE